VTMSCSTYTYRDYASEYAVTEDIKSWRPMYLEPILSKYLLGINCGVPTLVEDTLRNPLEDNSVSLSPISNLQAESLPVVTTEVMEESVMEPLTFLNTNVVTETMSYLLPTFNRITNGNNSLVVVSISNYGIKHIIVKIPGCILCICNDEIALYVPSTLLRKTRSDLQARSFLCKIENFKESNVFYRVKVPQKLKSKCIRIYSPSRRNTTPSHTPLLEDGFKNYCNVNMSMSIVLTPSRTTESSSFDDTPIVQHGKRLINLVVLDVDS
jgi:hypothetical protein